MVRGQDLRHREPRSAAQEVVDSDRSHGGLQVERCKGVPEGLYSHSLTLYVLKFCFCSCICLSRKMKIYLCIMHCRNVIFQREFPGI